LGVKVEREAVFFYSLDLRVEGYGLGLRVRV
jgi:hypothetical protein